MFTPFASDWIQTILFGVVSCAEENLSIRQPTSFLYCRSVPFTHLPSIASFFSPTRVFIINCSMSLHQWKIAIFIPKEIVRSIEFGAMNFFANETNYIVPKTLIIVFSHILWSIPTLTSRAISSSFRKSLFLYFCERSFEVMRVFFYVWDKPILGRINDIITLWLCASEKWWLSNDFEEAIK